jgi:glycine/D-amino acid oxidase-like deaminating enzyme
MKIIIIGSGVIGSSIALELSRLGHEVVVVDKGLGPGQGSTSSSSAVIRFNYSTYDSVALAWESFHCWKNWREHVGIELPAYSKLFDVGVIMIDAPVISTPKTAALFSDVGVPFEVWSPEALAQHAAGLDTGKYWPPKVITTDEFWEDASEQVGAIFTPQGGYVDDPQLAAENLAAAAKGHGAEFRFKSTVTKVLRNGNRITGIEINDTESIEADVVVNAAGPWSTQINELAGVGSDFTIGLRPMRQEVHQVDSPKNLLPGPIVGDVDLGIYMRSTPNGSTLIGCTEPECDPLEWVADMNEVNMNRTQEKFEAQVTRAARRLPALQIPNTPSGIVGVYDVSADWTPIYDRTDVDGFYVAIGTSGNQFKNAPVVGQLMARLISEVENGVDHDNEPVIFTGPRTGNKISLGAFSRKRPFNSESTNSVMG